MLVLVANFVLIPDHRMRRASQGKKKKKKKKKKRSKRTAKKGLLMYGNLGKKRGNVFSFDC